ncbi:hypothetical protein [Lysinibacillus capsici]|uniref:hypothetical protein n=1 Tax=Lysinibacillus capsici TaxID=2115968 RepID=UPI002FDD328F
MKYWYIPVSVLLVIIGVKAAIDYNTFIANYAEFKAVMSQFFPSLTSAIYNAGDFEAYREKFNETILALLQSFFDIRSLPSALICLISGVVLLINPIRESIEDFVKSLFEHYFA